MLEKWFKKIDVIVLGKDKKRFDPFYGALRNLFVTPGHVTSLAPHARDAVTLQRLMVIVWLCAFPAMFWGMYNLGFQALYAIENFGATMPQSWHAPVIEFLAFGALDSSRLWATLVYGAVYFVPIYVVTFAVGIFWEVVFSKIRGHEISEGFFVSSILFALSLPATVPLWQVAIGISFGVIFGKEIFGGTGRNFLNPALLCRAFLYFAYPASVSGDVWIAVDGYTQATPLAQLANGATVDELGLTWSDAFFGNMLGSVGETSVLMIMIAAAVLLFTRVASWRIMVGVLVGAFLTSTLLNAFSHDASNTMLAIPFLWHIVLGGFAFGLVFMATDPVSAPMTHAARWMFGILIGFLTVVIRVFNPGYPEGIMLAILFANIFAPLFDYFVVKWDIRRRKKYLNNNT